MGAVTRLSVAALVDLNPQGEGQAVISEADATEIIERAIGFRSGRDEVKVTSARLTGPVGPAEPDETLARLQRVQAYVGLARNLSLAVAAFLVVLIIGLLAVRRTRRWRHGILALGLGLGWWMGGYQMLKGAHYLSHTVTTMLVAWLVVLLWRRALKISPSA